MGHKVISFFSFGFFLVLFPQGVTDAWASMALVKEIEGRLKMTQGGETREAKPGDLLFRGDRLESLPESWALLQFHVDGTQVKIAQEARVEFPREASPQLFLSQGLLWRKKTEGGIAFSVGTPLITTRALGSEFFIRLENPAHAMILVKEGTVEVDFREETFRVGPGTLAIFLKDQGARMSPVPESILREWTAPFEKSPEVVTFR